MNKDASLSLEEVMHDDRIVLKDGRYLIYYTFGGTLGAAPDRGDIEQPPPQPVDRTDEKGGQS